MDIDPFGEHDKMDAQPDTGETIPFTPGGVIEGRSTWEPEQETSFGGTSQKTEVLSKCFIMCYPKTWGEPQKHSISMISNLEIGNFITKARAGP